MLCYDERLCRDPMPARQHIIQDRHVTLNPFCTSDEYGGGWVEARPRGPLKQGFGPGLTEPDPVLVQARALVKFDVYL